MKVRELLHDGAEKLKAAGVPEAEHDAMELLAYVYGKTRGEMLLELNRDLCPGATGGTEPPDVVYCPGDCRNVITYRMVLARRAERVPLQHILGKAGFMGMDFQVGPEVLVPRQDTEVLVETVLEKEKETGISVLDLCTGSGCIAIALKKLGKYAEVTASDTDNAALKTARANSRLNSAPVSFRKSDLFEQLEDLRFDVIVSNPPYVQSAVIPTLEPEVRDHDPVLALDGGTDGLDFYRKITKAAGQHLHKGGRLYFEIGYDQGEAVSKLLKENGFTGVQLVQDLAGLDRVAYGTYAEN